MDKRHVMTPLIYKRGQKHITETDFQQFVDEANTRKATFQLKYSPKIRKEQHFIKIQNKQAADDSVIEESKSILKLEFADKDDVTTQKKQYLQMSSMMDS